MEIKKLNPELIVEFTKIKARKKELENEYNSAAPDIKKLMVNDQNGLVEETKKKNDKGEDLTVLTFAPSLSPFMLVLTQYQKRDTDWEKQCKDLLKEFLGKNWVKRWKEINAELDANKVDADRLEVEANPNYKG